MNTPATSWADQEPNFWAGVHETVRLFARALRRPLLVFGLSLGLAGMMAGYVLVKKFMHAPRFVIRAVETDYNVATAPRPKRKLRDHVHGAVFTHTRLLEIIKRHGLYPSLTRKNPRAAVESFREDIEVEVYRNYFVVERSAHEPPRSARISIRYRAEDPKQALAVTRDLGQLVIESENSAGRSRVEATRGIAASEAQKAQEDVLGLRQQLAATTRRWSSAAGEEQARSAVAMMELNAQLQNAVRRAEEAERRKVQVDLSAALEQQNIGIRFEVVDDGAVADNTARRHALAWVYALTTFLFGWPLVALAVGAFDSKLRDPDDVERLGMNLLGYVHRAPSIPNPSVGGAA